MTATMLARKVEANMPFFSLMTSQRRRLARGFSGNVRKRMILVKIVGGEAIFDLLLFLEGLETRMNFRLVIGKTSSCYQKEIQNGVSSKV
jgi:hypothetical protein